MASTPDRTTVKAAIDELTTKLRDNLVADPPTASAPFRRVDVALRDEESAPRPFLTPRLTRIRPLGVMDGDKVIEVTMTLRLVTDVAEADPHGALLDKIGAVDDYLESLQELGVLEGVEGFDDRSWTIEYPKATAGSRLAAAEGKQTFVVKVERQQNRVPAA